MFDGGANGKSIQWRSDCRRCFALFVAGALRIGGRVPAVIVGIRIPHPRKGPLFATPVVPSTVVLA